jgi:hypothetical protein
VTQRTANVTKSILNQCNTIFGMRVYDATGMGFPENYVGPAYAPLLATLRDRQAVVFGRASSCNAPLIVDLNHTDSFLDGFWKSRSAAVPRTEFIARQSALTDPNPADDGADDAEIPF